MEPESEKIKPMKMSKNKRKKTKLIQNRTETQFSSAVEKPVEIELTIEQKKKLFDKIYDGMKFLHNQPEHSSYLKSFIAEKQRTRMKGIVLLNYTSIDDMTLSWKLKVFEYEWVSLEQARYYTLAGIPKFLRSMNPSKDCLFVCRLDLDEKNYYINCTRFIDYC